MRQSDPMTADSDETNKHNRELEERFFDLSIDLLCFLDFSGYFKRLNPGRSGAGVARAAAAGRAGRSQNAAGVPSDLFVLQEHPRRSELLGDGRDVHFEAHQHSIHAQYLSRLLPERRRTGF